MSVSSIIADSYGYPRDITASLSDLILRGKWLVKPDVQYRANGKMEFIYQAIHLSGKCILSAQHIQIKAKNVFLNGSKESPIIIIANKYFSIQSSEILMEHVHIFHDFNASLHIPGAACKQMEDVHLIEIVLRDGKICFNPKMRFENIEEYREHAC